MFLCDLRAVVAHTRLQGGAVAGAQALAPPPGKAQGFLAKVLFAQPANVSQGRLGRDVKARIGTT
jgi:hypothetical protein